MKSLAKKTLTTVLISWAFSIIAFSTQTPYCIRLYCGKDTTKKFMEAGKSKKVPALYDSDSGIYIVNNFNTLGFNCPSGKQPYGTNAAMYESLTSWVPVMLTSTYKSPKIECD